MSEFPGWGVRRALERRAAASRSAADITPWDILKEAERLVDRAFAVATQISQSPR